MSTFTCVCVCVCVCLCVCMHVYTCWMGVHGWYDLLVSISPKPICLELKKHCKKHTTKSYGIVCDTNTEEQNEWRWASTGHTMVVRQMAAVTSFMRGRILITSLVRMLTTMLLPSASITSILSILLQGIRRTYNDPTKYFTILMPSHNGQINTMIMIKIMAY